MLRSNRKLHNIQKSQSSCCNSTPCEATYSPFRHICATMQKSFHFSTVWCSRFSLRKSSFQQQIFHDAAENLFLWESIEKVFPSCRNAEVHGTPFPQTLHKRALRLAFFLCVLNAAQHDNTRSMQKVYPHANYQVYILHTNFPR